MLHCGRNYKGTKSEICTTCGVVDNEDHIINYCPKFVTLRESLEHIDFNNVYSDQIEVIKKVIPVIELLWNTANANGSLRCN